MKKEVAYVVWILVIALCWEMKKKAAYMVWILIIALCWVLIYWAVSIYEIIQERKALEIINKQIKELKNDKS